MDDLIDDINLFYGTPCFEEEVYNKNLIEVYNIFLARGKIFIKNLFEVYNKNLFYGTPLRVVLDIG